MGYTEIRASNQFKPDSMYNFTELYLDAGLVVDAVELEHSSKVQNDGSASKMTLNSFKDYLLYTCRPNRVLKIYSIVADFICCNFTILS
jgi:hypothetical protein